MELIVKTLKGILSHNESTKEKYKLPASLINQVKEALKEAEKGQQKTEPLQRVTGIDGKEYLY